MDTSTSRSHALIGAFRRFGVSGPVYEVVGVGRINDRGEQMMHIYVFDSGEHAEYNLGDIIEDPAAD